MEDVTIILNSKLLYDTKSKVKERNVVDRMNELFPNDNQCLEPNWDDFNMEINQLSLNRQAAGNEKSR